MASIVDNIAQHLCDLDVDLAEDGRLLSSGWNGYQCSECGSYHINLTDKNGLAFASLTIEEQDMEKLACVLLSLAAEQAWKREDNPFTRH
jgi:hypothetical protein